MVTHKNCLPLCLISNDQALIRVADDAGIDRIMLDLEVMGKAERQAGTDLFFTDHNENNVSVIKKILKHAKCMVRINPIHAGSQQEVDRVIASGADIVMLPFFQNAQQVQAFVDYVDGRVGVSLLLETKDAAENIHSIAAIPGIDEIHIGLNDLCLSFGNKTIFDVIIDGTLERLRDVIESHGIRFSFGGVTAPSVEGYPVSPTFIIAEQMRLHSKLAIVSRRLSRRLEAEKNAHLFPEMLEEIESIAQYWKNAPQSEHEKNRKILIEEIQNWKK